MDTFLESVPVTIPPCLHAEYYVANGETIRHTQPIWLFCGQHLDSSMVHAGPLAGRAEHVDFISHAGCLFVFLFVCFFHTHTHMLHSLTC